MSSNKIIYQVDSFTEEPFKGNPAGVMILDKEMDSTWMQNIAMEMNLSETAFLLPQGKKYKIRYFTPEHEVALCGHATLASAHILYEVGLVEESNTIHFVAMETELIIAKENNWIVMNFPKYSLTQINTPKRFKNIVGFEPKEVYSSDYQWIIAVSETENDIINSTPDFEAMKANKLGHLMITAESSDAKTDFVVRCFGPSLGINEDPVTGSAHCALTPLWAKKKNKTEMISAQLSKRTGKLIVKLLNDKVEIKGKAITILKSELKIPYGIQ
ncbi:MAG: PhzF family phenazine biosynthesis protein [Vicingus serpentipes]|nr:PhzF family phenazine biosynthesis protein [Vicingus serpentipes]